MTKSADTSPSAFTPSATLADALAKARAKAVGNSRPGDKPAPVPSSASLLGQSAGRSRSGIEPYNPPKRLTGILRSAPDAPFQSEPINPWHPSNLTGPHPAEVAGGPAEQTASPPPVLDPVPDVVPDEPPADVSPRTDDVIHLPDQSAVPAAAPEKIRTRSGSETRARPFVMRFRLTHAEHAEMQDAANAAGLELGAYARREALQPPESRAGESHETTRPFMLSYRVTADERAEIEALADRAGLTTGSYVRARGLKRPVTLTTRRPPVEKAELARLLGQLGRVGGNLHQLVRGQNSGRDVPAVDATEAIGQVEEAAREIIRALGRKPG